MDANNNEIAEQGYMDFFNEMCDYGAYSRDSEEEQNYFSSSGVEDEFTTENEFIGMHKPQPNPPGIELLGSTNVTHTEDDVLHTHASDQREYLENDTLMWNNPKSTWSTFNYGMFDLPDLVPFESFNGPENNLDPSINEVEDLNDFSYPPIIENYCRNEFTWDQKDTLSCTDPSGVDFGYCSRPQAAIPDAKQHSLLPRSYLMDETVALSVAQRAFSSNVLSVGMQETGVPRRTSAMETHVMSHEVDSQYLVTSNLLAFQVPENPKGKDPQHSHKALAPVVPLQGTPLFVTRRDPVSIIPSQIMRQDYFSSFEFRPGSSKKLSTRSCYNPDKRSRVADTRKKGACVACQARKVECKAVSGLDACMNCIKKAGEAITLRNICVRQQLKGTRFGIEGDFYYLASRRRTLLEYDRYYEVNKANVTITRISIGHAPKFGIRKLLPVVVQVYPGNDIGDRFFKVGRVGGSNRSLFTAEHYMIVKSSLPSVEQLDLWGGELVQANCSLDPHSLKSAMDSILIRYCDVNKNPHIAQILDPTLRIVSLNACRTRPPVNFEKSMNRLNDPYGNWSDKDCERGVDVSDEVLAQLVHIALVGIEDAEKSVLGRLDRLRKETKIGRLEWVAVGICLMRLLLVYRDLTLRYVNGAKQVGSKARGNIDSRVKRALLMYDTLTAVYGATFHKTTSPLSGQLRTEDHLEALCNDQSLMKAMEGLEFHYRRFCGGEEFEPEDAFFKTLIAMPMMQQGQKKQKKDTKDELAKFKQEI